jgi:hypothetical protein
MFFNGQDIFISGKNIFHRGIGIFCYGNNPKFKSALPYYIGINTSFKSSSFNSDGINAFSIGVLHEASAIFPSFIGTGVSFIRMPISFIGINFFSIADVIQLKRKEVMKKLVKRNGLLVYKNRMPV